MLKKYLIWIFVFILSVSLTYGAQNTTIDILFNNGTTEDIMDDVLRVKNITVNHDLVTSDLIDFPILINITDTDLRDYAQSDGLDIYFFDVNGVNLSHEIELYENTTGQLVAWVKVNLSSSVDTIITMAYGNGIAIQNPTDVWDEFYKGIYHLDSYNSTYTNDSTGNLNDGELVALSEVSCLIGNCQDFDGSNDYVDFFNNNLTGGQEEITLEMWVNSDDNLTDSVLYDAYYDPPPPSFPNWQFSIFLNNYYTRDNSTNVSGTRNNDLDWSVPVVNNWFHLAVRYSVKESVKSIYINGELQVQNITSIDILTNERDEERLGYASDGFDFDGQIDEFRISTGIARNVSWINTSYISQSNPNFYSVGSEVIIGDVGCRCVFNTSFYEQDEIDTYLNWTVDDNPISTGGCNVTYDELNITHPTFYNATVELWKTNFSINYTPDGNQSVSVICSNETEDYDTSKSTTVLYIVNIAPEIQFVNLTTNETTVNLSTSPIIEYLGGEWNFTFDVIDDDEDYSILSWYCNNTLLLNVTLTDSSLSYNTPNALFIDFKNLYNNSCTFNITAVDTGNENNITYGGVYFTVIDTVLPLCYGFENVTEWELDTYYNWTSADYCQDDNFFSLNISGNNSYEFYIDGINDFIYSPNGQGYNVTERGEVLFLIEACDGHSINLTGEDDFTKGKDVSGGKVNFDSATISTKESLSDITYQKNEDGTSYNVCFELNTASKTGVFTFELSKGFEEYYNPLYAGYFANPKSRIWWDSKNYDRDEITTEGREITITSKSLIGKKNICFDSIGKFNCINFTQNIRGGDWTSPIITLISPENDSTEDYNSLMDFKASVNELSNCTLYYNDTAIRSLDGVNGSFIFEDVILLNGTSYEWFVNCSDVVGNTNISESWILNVILTNKISDSFGIFNTKECVLQKSQSDVLAFGFIVFVLFLMLIINEVKLKIPFITFLTSFGFFIVSLSLWACSYFIAIIVGLFGITLALVEWMRFTS